MERDAIMAVIREEIFISTHTLTWSVTLPSLAAYTAYDISTHTLTWSVTIHPK